MPRMEGLDPEDWSSLRALGHRMLDDMFDHLAHLRDGPVWRPMPQAIRRSLGHETLPRAPSDPSDTYETFLASVLPYTTGNLHPRFMGWVHGGGNPVGMLAEMLAGGLNANLGGRDHAPIEIERQVIAWAAQMLDFPSDASGLLVTGTSIANMIGILVARTAALGNSVQQEGVGGSSLVAYTSAAAHACIARGMDMAGFGTDALRVVPTDRQGRLHVPALRRLIAADMTAGRQPFLLVGTAGSVDTGAIDDLTELSTVAREHGLWFHVDGAFGALAALSPRLRPLLAGIERADSVAFDFHKWAQVPYDAGCILVRDRERQLATFASDAAYLRRAERGLAGGDVWPCDLGPDLSRGFRALKVWMTFKAYGADRIGQVIEQTCELARHLAARVEAEPSLELLAPVNLNIVCFRFRTREEDVDRLNGDIVADLQEDGIAAPSTTTLQGRLAIRAAIVNHRTRSEDVDELVAAVLRFGHARVERIPQVPGVRRPDTLDIER